MTISIDRSLDLSVFFFTKNLFADAPFINVTEGFPDTELTIPTIAVELDNITTQPFEMGDRSSLKLRTWFIDVFAADKAQRDEYAYRLLNALENTIPVYNYDEGFPPSSTPSRIGCLITDDIRLQIIKVLPELTERMYYRSTVMFVGEYNPA